MKTIGAGLFAVVLILGLTGVDAYASQAAADKKLFTKHFQDTLFEIAEKATFSVEVLLDEKEYKIGKDVVGLVLHNDKDEDVAGAKLTIVQRNLQTGEPAPGPITVKDKGDGLYIVSGLDLKQEGGWELIITAAKAGAEDRVRFVLPGALKERHPKGRYSP